MRVSSRFVSLMVLLAICLAAGTAVVFWAFSGGGIGWVVWANQWIADTFIHRLGYWGVFALMFIESSFVPFPSEIIIPPAADLARRLPDWNLAAVILLGCGGSLGGALFNYTLALYLGRPVLLRFIGRFGRYLLLTQSGYERAEDMFRRHGAISTFTGRLIPGIRQIISLPAGLARMNLLVFSLLTALGAGCWVALLALLGYYFGDNAELLAHNMSLYSRWLAAGAILLIAGYAFFRWRRYREETGRVRGSEGASM